MPRTTDVLQNNVGIGKYSKKGMVKNIVNIIIGDPSRYRSYYQVTVSRYTIEIVQVKVRFIFSKQNLTLFIDNFYT